MGGQLGETAIVIGLGAMIGRVMGDAGASQRIAQKILAAFDERGVQWAMVASAMLIGVTMFYEVAFVILVPVAFTLVRATRVNLLWVGLPMSISLSTMHSFLPRILDHRGGRHLRCLGGTDTGLRPTCGGADRRGDRDAVAPAVVRASFHA